MTPLHAASLHGHKDVVKFLVQNGADLNSNDNWNCTALHNAAGAGHLQIVDLLCQAGANLGTIHKARGHSFGYFLSPILTLSNRFKMHTKKCCVFPAAFCKSAKKFGCAFATYSTMCIPPPLTEVFN